MSTLDYQSPNLGGEGRIVHTRQDEEEVFVARPLGLGKTGHGAVFLLCVAAGLLLGSIGAFLLLMGESGWSVAPAWPIVISASIGVLGFAMAAVGTHWAYTSTSLVVTRDSLRIVRSGPVLAGRVRAWPLGIIERLEVDDISYQCDSSSVCGKELYRLEIRFQGGERKVYLTGYGKGELTWLASTMNEVISGRRVGL